MKVSDFNLGMRKEWQRNLARHKASVIASTSRLDNKKPESFTPAFHTLRSQAFRKLRTLHSETERLLQQENEALADRLARVQPEKPSAGLLRRSQEHQLQLRNYEIHLENERLLRRIINAQPTLSARNMSENFRSTRVFHQLRQVHGKPAQRSAPQAHSAHIGLEVVMGRTRFSDV